ncbi:hypothetical protein HW537_01620 [Asaia siamensis]
MFPGKINHFVSELLRKTEQGLLNWLYDDENSSVQVQTREFTFSLGYNFNKIEEVGEFVIIYFSAADGKEYRFYTNQTWSDYDLARRLFQAAQASVLQLPF